MALPSPLRASALMLAIAGGLAGVLGVLLWDVDRVGALVAPLLLFGIFSLAELQAAWRLNRALARFAAALPGEPVPMAGWTGEQGLAWPDIPVRVRGHVFRFGVRDLVVEAGGDAWTSPPSRAAEAGRAAAAKVGLAPRLGPWDGALPGPGPARAALGTVAVLGALAAALWVIREPLLAGALAFLAVAGGAAQAAGVARHRGAVRDFLEGLRAGGVEVQHVDVLATGMAWRWAAYTSAGQVDLEGAALPRAPLLLARAGAIGVEAPVAEARRAGQGLAERLRLA